MCELVMTGETKQFKEHLSTLEKYPEPDSSDEEDDDLELMESYDIEMESFDLRRTADRPTSITNRLEKIDQSKRKTARMKHIKWDMRKNTQLSKEQIDDLFVKKDLTENQECVQKSALTEIIEQCTNLPLNPFMEFAKFDGSGQVNIPTRQYRIFLTMLPEAQRNYPINICCVATAKIQDLIGLILLKISTNHSDYAFKPVTHYGLYITEEDGEVDRDLPCLDAKESVAKFGFPCLGLVEHKDAKSVTFDKSEAINLTTIDAYSRLRKTREDESKQIKNDLQLMDVHNKAMEAPLYQSYHVFIIHKVRARIEILLGISGEKLEIDPVQQKNSKFTFVKQKAVSHHMDTVAWCEITDIKSNRTTFKVVYTQSFDGGTCKTVSIHLELF